MCKRVFAIGCVVVLFLSVFSRRTLAQERRLLCGFNTEKDLKACEWSATGRRLVTENTTEGTKCVEVTFGVEKNDYRYFYTLKLLDRYCRCAAGHIIKIKKAMEDL